MSYFTLINEIEVFGGTLKTLFLESSFNRWLRKCNGTLTTKCVLSRLVLLNKKFPASVTIVGVVAMVLTTANFISL